MDSEDSKLKTSIRIKILIGLLTVLLIVMMFPKGESIEFEVVEGTIWIHDDLIAPFTFPVKKDAELYRAELREAANSVYPVFVEDENGSLMRDSLERYNNFLLRNIDSSLKYESTEFLNPTFLSQKAYAEFREQRAKELNLSLRVNLRMKDFFTAVNNSLELIYKEGVIGTENLKLTRDSIAVRTGNIDRIAPLGGFYSPERAREAVRNYILNRNFPAEIEQALAEYAVHFVAPNINFNERLTKEEVEQAQSNVSQFSGIVNENERIIAKHDRVNKDARLKIESYKEAKGETIGQEGLYFQLVGKFLHIAFLLSMITIYFYLFRKKIFQNNLKILIIAINLLFISFLTYLTNRMDVNAPVHYLIFIPASSMLLTIIFDSRVGFYSTVIMALTAGALRGNDYTFAAASLFAGALAVYTVRDIKNRSQIFRSFVFILIGYVVAVLAFGLERFASWNTILFDLAFAGSNALISPVLTYGLLIFFERSFKITTDLTLLELSNFDRPLLKELARRAPGTFNHSMTMGTLAETAAEKINANPLLARVGAYYHDIGKTILPQNFVENQLDNRNIHENLTPEESINIIINHVKGGIELARKHGVPEEIVDFIPMHHGTTTIQFFYDKAIKLYGPERVSVEDYQYPGPVPNTKETAVVMLADSCESAVRSIDNPDPAKVENVINGIIKSRIDEGQLDESPLTFSDINKIKEAFISILMGQHHRRIRYPKQEEMESGTEEPQDQK
jgi:cyclic-di-AMP phosphodiesterase PgpH